MAGVKGKSGRKKTSLERAHTSISVAEAGSAAAEYIKAVVEGDKETKVEPVRLDSCWKVVYQLLGKPPQRIYQDIDSQVVTRIEVTIKRESIDNAQDTA